MRVDKLLLENFRSYESASVELSPGINVVLGENAQGKTNLLEACFFLSLGRAFRTRREAELIRFNSDFSFIKGEIFSDGREQTIEARMFADRRKKQLFKNGVKLRGPSELSGALNCVLFGPEELFLIKNGASERRGFMDSCLCQLRPRYAEALSEYSRLLEHKTRILKDGRENPSLYATLDDFSYRMAQTGAMVISYRARLVERLKTLAARAHSDISGSREALTLEYKTVSSIPDTLAGAKELYPLLWEHYVNHKQAEIASASCLSGPHRDDLEACINGLDARKFASQGQVRTAALSLKLAERDLYLSDAGEPPVLLLDDVLSELDESRRDFVINRLSGGQVIITTCGDVPEHVEGKVFEVANGKVEETQGTAHRGGE